MGYFFIGMGVICTLIGIFIPFFIKEYGNQMTAVYVTPFLTTFVALLSASDGAENLDGEGLFVLVIVILLSVIFLIPTFIGYQIGLFISTRKANQ